MQYLEATTLAALAILVEAALLADSTLSLIGGIETYETTDRTGTDDSFETTTHYVQAVGVAPGGGGGFTTVFKVVQQTKNSNAALALDSALQFPVLANKSYTFRLKAFFYMDGTPSLKFAFATPAIAGTLPFYVKVIGVNTTAQETILAPAAHAVLPVPSTPIAVSGFAKGIISIEGDFIVEGAGGVAGFQWAQNTSDVGDTVLWQGCYLEYKQVD